MRNGRRAGTVLLVAAATACGGMRDDRGRDAANSEAGDATAECCSGWDGLDSDRDASAPPETEAAVEAASTGTCPGGTSQCGTQCVSEQTDANHCGACGHSCQGAGCISGVCQALVLASGQIHPWGIAVDSTSVYWATGGLDATGTVMKMPIGGGIPVTLASGPGAFGVAVDATSVYWIYGGASGSVMKVPIGGGSPITLASAQSFPGFVAVDSANVYFTRNGPVMKIPIGGGIPATVASAAAGSGIAVDATGVYWTDGGSTANGSVMKQPIGGGSPVTLATGQSYAAFLTLDSANVYWTDNASGNVMKVPVTGGNPVTLASGQPGPWGIAVDATRVYWTNGSANGGTTVMKAPIGGGTPVTLASGQQNPNQITVDATSVYWTNYTAGTVMKVVKE